MENERLCRYILVFIIYYLLAYVSCIRRNRLDRLTESKRQRSGGERTGIHNDPRREAPLDRTHCNRAQSEPEPGEMLTNESSSGGPLLLGDNKSSPLLAVSNLEKKGSDRGPGGFEQLLSSGHMGGSAASSVP